MLKLYQGGKLSLEVVSKTLDLSVSETIDLLAELEGLRKRRRALIEDKDEYLAENIFWLPKEAPTVKR
jgi:hypothetical protein